MCRKTKVNSCAFIHSGITRIHASVRMRRLIQITMIIPPVTHVIICSGTLRQYTSVGNPASRGAFSIYLAVMWWVMMINSSALIFSSFSSLTPSYSHQALNYYVLDQKQGAVSMSRRNFYAKPLSLSLSHPFKFQPVILKPSITSSPNEIKVPIYACSTMLHSLPHSSFLSQTNFLSTDHDGSHNECQIENRTMAWIQVQNWSRSL